MKNTTNHLSKVFEERKYFTEFLVIIIGLGIGLEILANGIIEYFRISPLFSIVFGSIFTIFGAIFVAKRLLAHRILKKNIQGVIFYREKDLRILDPYPYDFGSSIYSYFYFLFNENEAIKRRWEKENLNFLESDFQDKRFNHYGYCLLVNASQYYLIQKISTHLTDYFASLDLKEKKLINLKREDIPEILFKNEFLEIFSKPMNLRPKFEDEDYDESIISAFDNEVMFEKFEITLPKKSSLHIKDKDKLIIKTPRFEMEIKTIFEGDGGYDSHSEILKYYFGIKKTKKVIGYNIKFEVIVKFKALPLFTKRGWLYYNWIDSLLDWLNEEISFESFSESINWKTISTIMQVEKIKKKRNPAV